MIAIRIRTLREQIYNDIYFCYYNRFMQIIIITYYAFILAFSDKDLTIFAQSLLCKLPTLMKRTFTIRFNRSIKLLI